MYSPKVIDASLAKLRDAKGISLTRYPVDYCRGQVERLSKLAKDDGTLTRSLTTEEKGFITNEQLMSKVDFLYWGERYARIAKDGGGVTLFHPWVSQRIILERHIAKVEEEMHERQQRGEPVDGILLVCDKARQLGMTALSRVLTVHRTTTSLHTRALAASIDDTKVFELYDRDKFIIDNLPWFLKPSLGYDEKAQHIYFDKLSSRIFYQTAQQRAGTGVGLGQGQQFDLGHLTELASFAYPNAIPLDYFPTIPQSLRSLHILESTPQGRGNWWHEFCVEVQSGQSQRWRFVFIPQYAEPTKNIRRPPDTWRPSEHSIRYAQKVYDTSPEWVGESVMLTRDQLYWYETSRDEATRGGNLALFLTNYAATPEESFQHISSAAFSSELLQSMGLDTDKGTPYEIHEVAR